MTETEREPDTLQPNERGDIKTWFLLASAEPRSELPSAVKLINQHEHPVGVKLQNWKCDKHLEWKWTTFLEVNLPRGVTVSTTVSTVAKATAAVELDWEPDSVLR